MRSLREFLTTALSLALFGPLALLGPACTTEEPLDQAGELDLPGFEDFFDGKGDTGYVGSRAAELEAVFEGRVRVLLPDESPQTLQNIAEVLLRDPRSWEFRHITVQVTEQLKYARNALKSAMLNLNLEGGSPTFTSIDVVEGGLELAYTVRVESLVKFKDLESQGLTAQDLVGRVVEPRVPLVPAGLFERIGAACATDPDTGATVAAEDLGAHNLFYYFDPARQGCTLTESDLVTASYRVESSLDTPTVYPEYDLLVADGRVDMVAIFGQITHGELSSSDWGFIAYNSMAGELRRLGFAVAQTFEGNSGQRLERTYPGGLKVSVSMYTPVGFADTVPREEANTRFRDALRNHEIVYYNGHAFYGSLTVLDDPDVYPAGVYQIINMDACWSYAYYTKQIFRNRATPDDPEGYALVDVVNNTEPGITGSERTAVILYDNLFRGAAAAHSGADPSLYSWNHIVVYMNEHATARARSRVQYPDPEIYGVSGVATNRFQPGSRPGGGGVVSGTLFEGTGEIAIPDADEAGIQATITVPPSAGRVASMRVRVEIAHGYVGDLTVELSHAGQSLLLHDRTGGSGDDLSLDLTTEHFAGAEKSGDWVLRVADHAQLDTGRLLRWSLEL